MELTAPFPLHLAAEVERNVLAALVEDIGGGDLTALLTPAGKISRGTVISREEAVLCGAAWFDACFRRLDPAAAHLLARARRRAHRRRPDAVRNRGRHARPADRRAHRAQLPATAVGHGHRHAPLRRCRRRHPARKSSIPARPCPACAWRRNTRCAAAAAPTTASASTTAS